MTAELTALKLPSHVEDWAQQNRALLQQVDARMSQKGPLAEETIWTMVAEGCSPAWASAKKGLKQAAENLGAWTSDDNMPLGAIGMALDGGEMDKLQGRYNVALAHFTAIEEALRNEQGPKALMEAVRQRMRVIADVEHTSKLAERANRKFMRMTNDMQNAPQKSKFLGQEFDANSRRRTLLSPWEALQGGMKQLLVRCLMMEPALAVTAEQKAEVAAAPAAPKPQNPLGKNALRRYLNNNMN